MKYKITLNGGPLDGTIMDMEPIDPDATFDGSGPMCFGGMIYEVDPHAGVGQFVSGRDEKNILGQMDSGGDGE